MTSADDLAGEISLHVGPKEGHQFADLVETLTVSSHPDFEKTLAAVCGLIARLRMRSRPTEKGAA